MQNMLQESLSPIEIVEREEIACMNMLQESLAPIEIVERERERVCVCVCVSILIKFQTKRDNASLMMLTHCKPP